MKKFAAERQKRRLNISEYPDVMSIKDLCEFLAISRLTAYRFLQENNVKYMFVGREYRISKESLKQHLGLK